MPKIRTVGTRMDDLKKSISGRFAEIRNCPELKKDYEAIEIELGNLKKGLRNKNENDNEVIKEITCLERRWNYVRSGLDDGLS